MPITYQALPTEIARHYQRDGADANGHLPERSVSDGKGVPCRHCMDIVPAGQEFLILSHRPFPEAQPYAEQGPIFLCAGPCKRADTMAFPAFLQSPEYILRGYSTDNRIVYGSGVVVDTPKIPEAAEALLAREDIAYLHVRSASNNCYHLRIERQV